MKRLDRMLDRPAFWFAYAALCTLIAIVTAALALAGLGQVWLIAFAVNLGAACWGFYKGAYYAERA